MASEGSSDWLRRARSGWRWVGDRRPPWAHPAGPTQESVWDYPRPPRMAADERRVTVSHEGSTIADTNRAIRILETASPPAVYIPREDVRMELLVPEPGSSLCEWKGAATCWTVVLPEGSSLAQVGWSYEKPFPEFSAIAGYLSFYPARLRCTLGNHVATPQPGGFYGGWVTPEIVGPFKGEGRSAGW